MMTQHILIIGAGMAGIMAGRTLQEAGHSVAIVEGRARIGGRTHTDSTLGPDIDMGGAWIHGPHGNPLTPLAAQYGVGTGYTDFHNETGDKVLAFDGHGRQLDTAAYTRGEQIFRGALAHLHGSILHQMPPDECQSLADLHAHGLPHVNLEALSEDERLGYYYAGFLRPQYEDATDLHLIDWRQGKSYIKLPGGDLLVHGGGYGKLIRGLAEGLTIHTDCAVRHIRYGAEGVTLTTTQGEMTADRVVITVPLGVLQAGHITFEPPLPEEKTAAIGRLGMGFYEKIALKFPHIFWPLRPHRFNYLPEGERPLYTSWLNNAHYSGQPVLVAYHSGSRAQYINQLSDEDLIAGCMETLRKLFGADIPDPIGYVRTGWAQDPFSCGSYSYGKVGSSLADRARLAEPVDGRLFFAGEATHPHYTGTVHGAYETGIRAAKEVVRNMNDEG